MLLSPPISALRLSCLTIIVHYRVFIPFDKQFLAQSTNTVETAAESCLLSTSQHADTITGNVERDTYFDQEPEVHSSLDIYS